MQSWSAPRVEQRCQAVQRPVDRFGSDQSASQRTAALCTAMASCFGDWFGPNGCAATERPQTRHCRHEGKSVNVGWGPIAALNDCSRRLSHGAVIGLILGWPMSSPICHLLRIKSRLLTRYFALRCNGITLPPVPARRACRPIAASSFFDARANIRPCCMRHEFRPARTKPTVARSRPREIQLRSKMVEATARNPCPVILPLYPRRYRANSIVLLLIGFCPDWWVREHVAASALPRRALRAALD